MIFNSSTDARSKTSSIPSAASPIPSPYSFKSSIYHPLRYSAGIYLIWFCERPQIGIFSHLGGRPYGRLSEHQGGGASRNQRGLRQYRTTAQRNIVPVIGYLLDCSRPKRRTSGGIGHSLSLILARCHPGRLPSLLFHVFGYGCSVSLCFSRRYLARF